MPGPVCRAVRMASAGRRACLYRLALPLPLGAGDYVRPAVIGSACCEGAGGIVEVLLSIGSSSSFPACFAVSLCRSHPRPPPASCASFTPPASVLVLPPVFLCGFLSFPSPFLRLAGRGVLCLLAYSSRLSSSSPCSCLIALSFVSSPRLSTSVGGECVGSFLLACHRPPSCVRRLVSAGWCRRGWFVAWRGCVSACCVWFVVSVFVYINWVLARV